MADKPTPTRQTSTYKAIMLGLAAGAATFLVCRWVLQLGYDPSYIAAGFVGFAVGTYLVQKARGRT